MKKLNNLSINVLKRSLNRFQVLNSFNAYSNHKYLLNVNKSTFVSEANNFSHTRFGEEKNPENKSNFVTPTKIDFNVGGCPNSEFSVDLGTYFKNCYIEQIRTDCLSQFGYYIEADGNAFVVDPVRDIQYYLDLLKKRNAKLKFIGETHFHADFISGHVDLSDQTSSKIIFGPGATCDFPIVHSHHEMIFELSSKISIQLLHTPGHTLESCCFSIIEKQDSEVRPWKTLAVMTGDTLFLGDVGRPDLAVKSDLTSKDLATLLHNSIHILKKLPDECLVLPGHGSGSACGKNIQKGTMSTIGIQKKTNFALSDTITKEEFIEISISNLPTPPQYFFYDAIMNKKGLSSVKSIVEKSRKPIPPKVVELLMKNPDVKIVDTRMNSLIFEEGILPKSITIDMSMTYAIWAATLLKPHDLILLICEEGKEEEAMTRLTRVGFDNILGYLEGGIENWKKQGLATKSIHLEKNTEFVNKIPKNPYILDVRNEPEFKTPGILSKSQLIPLPNLEKNLSKVSKDEHIYILCRGGMRATIAASILISNGYTNEISVIEGGLERLMKNGVNPTPIDKI